MFLSLINDLFPGIVLDSATYEDLQAAIELNVDDMGIVNHPPWNLKVPIHTGSFLIHSSWLYLCVGCAAV